MASKTTKWCLCSLIFTSVAVVHAFIDIEELESINYGISILKEPVVIPESYPDSAILVTSKHGQQYQCNYPTHQEQKQQKEEEEKLALETGIVELLKPLSLQPCMIKTKDWWTYEVCFGQYIRQYHLEDGNIKGNIIYLGHYQSDFDWNNETLRETRVKSKISSGRYHSQYYTNGSKCDLTGGGRKSEIRFVCEEGGDDFVTRVDEPETCVYVITVHTSRICRHPHLKSPTPIQPIPIVCNPLLTNQQFQQYLRHTQAVKEMQERAKAQAEQALKEREAQAATHKADADIEGEMADSVNNILKKALGNAIHQQPEDETLTEEDGDEAKVEDEDEEGVSYPLDKDMDGLDDLDRLLDPQGILASVALKGKTKYTTVKRMQVKKKATGEAEYEMEEIEETYDDDVRGPGDSKKRQDRLIYDAQLEEFTKEIKKLQEKQAMTQERLKSIRDKVKDAVTSQFKTIIEEAEAEVGGDVDDGEAFVHLTESLNQLMEMLEETEEEMRDINTDLKETNARLRLRNDKLLGGSDQTTKKDAKKEEGIKEEEEKKEEESKEKEPRGVQAPPATLRSDKSSNQQKFLESHFEEQLKKAGIDPTSVKVHVKIIGSMPGDDDDDKTIHVITENNQQFQNMIVAILGGGSNEAVKEESRQASLEDGYSFDLDKVVADDDAATYANDNSNDNQKDANDKISPNLENGL